jgi:hypothetical protein
MSSLIASLLLHGTTASLVAAANLHRSARVRAGLGAVGIQLGIDAITAG